MGLGLHLIWAGRHSPEPWESLSTDYRKRIEAFVPIREQAIRVATGGEDRARRRMEGEALTTAAPKPAFLVALDERVPAGDLGYERWLSTHQGGFMANTNYRPSVMSDKSVA